MQPQAGAPSARAPNAAKLRAIVVTGGFHTRLRPVTLTVALPLLEFCNETLLMHQLRALKEAGVKEVILCVHERALPAAWDAYVSQVARELEISVESVVEENALGNAGAFKAAEAKITADGNDQTPFIVVNSDVLCTYPLRDILHTHIKHGRECTVLTTRCIDSDALSGYGVCVVDERTGRVRHFVYKPQTFVSDVINAGVYVFSPSIFKRIDTGRKVFMQEILVRRAPPCALGPPPAGRHAPAPPACAPLARSPPHALPAEPCATVRGAARAARAGEQRPAAVVPALGPLGQDDRHPLVPRRRRPAPRDHALHEARGPRRPARRRLLCARARARTQSPSWRAAAPSSRHRRPARAPRATPRADAVCGARAVRAAQTRCAATW